MSTLDSIVALDECLKNANIVPIKHFKLTSLKNGTKPILFLDNFVLIEQLTLQISTNPQHVGRVFCLNNLTDKKIRMDFISPRIFKFILLDQSNLSTFLKINSHQLVLHDVSETISSSLEIEMPYDNNCFFKLFICTNWD